MNKAKAHLFIQGRVQGVFFRAFTRNVAQKLGLNGWARNLYDGRVEAVFEGSLEVIELAITECKKGPPGSYVHDIEVTWEEYSGMPEGFAINY